MAVIYRVYIYEGPVRGAAHLASAKTRVAVALVTSSHTVRFALFGYFRATLVEGLDRGHLVRYLAHPAHLFALFQMRLLA